MTPRRVSATLLAVAAAAVCGCAASLWERVDRLTVGSTPARLFIPRTFAPLVPGSIYPDRSRPVPARGLAAVLVLSRSIPSGTVAESLGRRGLVALVGGPELAPFAGLEQLLRSPESGGRVGLFLETAGSVQAKEALAEEDFAAIVLFGSVPELPSRHAPLLVLAVGAPGGAAPPGVSERWYASPSGKLPAIALQDAADWLAERLR
jgi:hypothetical protein